MKRLKYAYGCVWYSLSGTFSRVGHALVSLSGECAHEAAQLQDDFNREKHRKFRENVLGQTN